MSSSATRGHTVFETTPQIQALPEGLALLHMRISMRLLVDTILPGYKGPMLRGGFGYAFQRAACPPSCWKLEQGCDLAQLCPFRWIFATPRPPGIEQLHDLQDIPRPFVLDPPTDDRRQYVAGDPLEFGLTLIGRAIDYLPYFLHSFEQLGHMGLGRMHAPARLERVEALRPWSATGIVVYQDGRALTDSTRLPYYDNARIVAQATQLPADLRLTLRTPLRLKARGDILRQLELPALIQAICWRLHSLSIFHGSGPWEIEYRSLMHMAESLQIEQVRLHWIDRMRTSTRGAQETMPQGGLLGSVVLRDVPVQLRALLLSGGIVHVGKACTFGHGGMSLEGV